MDRYAKRSALAILLPDGRIVLRQAAITVTVGPYTLASFRNMTKFWWE